MSDARRSQSSLATLLADNSAGDISAQDARDLAISTHPEKVIQTGAYASEPATGQLAGDLYLPSDSFYIERYSGSAWTPWGPIFPMTKPVNGDFSWVNQLTGAVDLVSGGIALTGVPTSFAVNLQARVKAVPATPYTIAIAFLFSGITPVAGGIQMAGVCWRQSSNDKLVTVGARVGDGKTRFFVGNWDDPADPVLDAYTDEWIAHGMPYFIRIGDTGTDRTTEFSADGRHWISVFSVSNTDHLTADQVGFFVLDSTNIAPVMTLLSWKEG
jgi:hypothetical protein